MPDGKAAEFLTLTRLIPKLYFKLQAFTANGSGRSGVTPGQRALMEDVDVGGPQTIGILAASRPVAKQYVQKLVADLVELGFVALSPNPSDGRSKLVKLTKKGRGALSSWRAAEEALVTEFLRDVSAKDVSAALEVLTRLHTALAEQTQIPE